MNLKNSRKFLTLCAVGAGLLSALPVMAKAPMKSASKMGATTMHKTAMHPTQMTGIVTGMTRSSLTVKPAMKSMGASKTVMIPRSAKIMMGAVPTSLAKLQAGEKVVVSMNAKGAVTRVQVVAQKKMMKKSSSKMMKKPMMKAPAKKM